MLGCDILGYTKPCLVSTGGVNQLLIGDANDFTLTAGAADADGNPVGYTVIARRTGATHAGGADLYNIDAVAETLGVDIAQTYTDGNSSYEYTVSGRLVQMSQALTNFNSKLDLSAQCCQIMLVWLMNDGKVFVIGEKYVGTSTLQRFNLRNDGSKISTGKKNLDFNGEDLSIKGSFYRKPYEFTGGWSAILAMQS